MDKNTITKLQKTANRARISALTGIFNAKSGNPGGSLSICDILSYLYFKEMNIEGRQSDGPISL